MLQKLVLSLVLVFPVICSAKLVQILHTNDLHGYFEHSEFRQDHGGYAAIKTLMDRHRKEASDQGIPTLTLDAGDYMEGNLTYFYGKGARTLEILNLLGYDAITIGNHDYLMGVPGLNEIFGKTKLNFKLLGANIKFDKEFKAANEVVQKSVIFHIGGMKIGIVGVTTNEIFYRWRFDHDGGISNPKKAANKYAKRLKEEYDVDQVIALTHLGVETDKELVKDSRDIDLIVGGHSHDALYRPVWAYNDDNRPVPIVQAGAHGRFLGKLVVDLKKGQPVQIVSYELIPVTDVPRDPEVQYFVDQTYDGLYQIFGKDWLEEKIGETKIELIHSNNEPSIWGRIIAESMLEASGADVAFHSNTFAGASLPIGDLNRRQMFNTHPRVLDTNQLRGWTIWTVDVRGFLLKLLIKIYMKTGYAFHVSGLEFDYTLASAESNKEGVLFEGELSNEEYDIDNIFIGGSPLKNWQRYRVALSEGIVVGGLGISSLLKIVLRNRVDTRYSLWRALSEKVQRIGIITTDYGRYPDSSAFSLFYQSDKKKNKTSPYKMIPARLFR